MKTIRLNLMAAAFASHAAWAQLPPPPESPTPVRTYEYDAQGNVTKVTRNPGGLNLQTKASYDPLERVKDVTDPKQGKTQFQYDGGDRTTQVTDPRNLVTQYPRDGFGDATQLVSPDTGITNLSYDAARRLKTRTDSRGVTETYTYDLEGRLTSIAYTQAGQPSQTVTWTWDLTGPDYSYSIGRLSRTDHPAGSASFKYDPWGAVVATTQRVAPAAGANTSEVVSVVRYGYLLKRLNSITYPSGRVLNLIRSGRRVSSLSLSPDAGSSAATLISGIKYFPFGPVESWNWEMAAGQQAHERVYDLNGRIVRQRIGDGYRDIRYDAADRIVSFTHLSPDGTPQAALDQSFSYDENDRITGITTSTASWAISYDANGNRTSVSLNGSPSVYSTEATSNRLTSISNPTRNFGYDNAGNTLTDSGNYSASYNLRGQIATITKGSVTGSYTYDAEQRRVRKVTSTGEVIIFVYDLDGQLLGEYDQNGQAIREYVWLDDVPVAMFMPDPANVSGPPLVYYIHADHLNAPRVVVDRNNAKRWRWMAEPFGTTAPETNPGGLGVFTQNLRFPGQYADAESGLFYNYFRSFDSSRGGYTQSDPIGLVAGSLSTFSYVNNSPLDAVDPEGLKSGNYVRPPPGPDYDPTLIRHSLGPKYDNLRFRQKCERAPDFVNFQIDAYVFSVWGTFTRDGNSFVGGGLNRSFVNPFNLSASATAGWLNRRTVAPGDVNNFAGGYSGAAAAAFVGLGGGLMVSPGNGTATIVGFGAGYTKGPSWKGSAAVGGGYSADMGETGLAWPAGACSCTR